jgi:hypothetical protein
VSLAGRRRLLSRIAGAASVLDVSRDGRLVIEHSVSRFAVRGRGPGEAAERELNVFDRTALLDLSADGRHVLLSEWGSAAGRVSWTYLRATDGSDPVRLGQGDPLSLSPDGRWFAQSSGSDSAPTHGVLTRAAGPRARESRVSWLSPTSRSTGPAGSPTAGG